MKTIPNEYRKNGTSYNLITRSEFKAIYSQSINDKVTGYEVVRIRRHKKDVKIQNKLVFSAGDERLPSNEDWGSHGFTYTSKSKALEKFETQF